MPQKLQERPALVPLQAPLYGALVARPRESRGYVCLLLMLGWAAFFLVRKPLLQSYPVSEAIQSLSVHVRGQEGCSRRLRCINAWQWWILGSFIKQGGGRDLACGTGYISFRVSLVAGKYLVRTDGRKTAVPQSTGPLVSPVALGELLRFHRSQ